MWFVAGAPAHVAHLPRGQTERLQCAVAMVQAQDRKGFGSRNRE